MRYQLVQIQNILKEYSRDYLNEHIIKSLEAFFKDADEKFLDDIYYQQDSSFPHININDVANPDAMLIFAYHGQTRTGAYNVSYVGRIKG